MSFFYEHKIHINDHINLMDTLFSGQSFRWNKNDFHKNYFTSVIHDCIVIITQQSPYDILIKTNKNTINGTDTRDFIHRYLSLDIDTTTVFQQDFMIRYPEVWKRVRNYLGVRVLRQDPFETMVTFMCAQGIGMGLIRRQVSMIAERYGRLISAETDEGAFCGYTFPSPADLSAADVSELAWCTNNNRIRAANIIAMARSFSSGEMALRCVQSGDCTIDSLRNSLCLHRGIGMKIADCIALFGLGRFDAFPIDTHVKQYLWEWIGLDTARKSLTPRNYLDLQRRATDILGTSYAGYAGHILFHCWRKEIRNMQSY